MKTEMIGHDPDRQASKRALIERIRLSPRGTQSGQAHNCMEDLAAGSPPNNLFNERARLARKRASEETGVWPESIACSSPIHHAPARARRLTPGY